MADTERTIELALRCSRSEATVESVDPEPVTTPPTLLSRLRAADPADISRPRKLKKNAAPVGKKRSHVAGRSAHNPKSTSPYQACQVVLIHPSSAAAERAFSLLNSSFATSQECALAEYVEVSLMLQFNGR